MTYPENIREARLEKYRADVRRTMQAFSDEALAFQDARIIGGIDREECDREIMRREDMRSALAFDEGAECEQAAAELGEIE